MEIGITNLFDIGGIAVILALCIALLVRGAVGKALRFDIVDAIIATFVTWCVTCAVVYPETLDIRGLAKLLTPLMGYTVAKNIVIDRAQYTRMVLLMLIGYVLPVMLSAILIAMGMGVEGSRGNYWTGILRWEGVYDGAHNMGHNMTFVLMLMAVYAVMRRSEDVSKKPKFSAPTVAMFGGLALLALYCLLMSQVRTAFLGILVFVSVILFFRHRMLLIVGGLVGTFMVIAFFPVLKPYLFPDLVMIERTGADSTEFASGRAGFWKSNLEHFVELPLDRQLAGVGIGTNRLAGFMDSHNDFLDVLVQTGLVGFSIFIALHIFILQRILRMSNEEKYVYLAVFLAVLVMNLGSNSYVARFGLAQMYYLIIAYINYGSQSRGKTVSADARVTRS